VIVDVQQQKTLVSLIEPLQTCAIDFIPPSKSKGCNRYEKSTPPFVITLSFDRSIGIKDLRKCGLRAQAILLVDDEAVDLTVMQRSLEKAGYTVFPAAHPDDAITVFHMHEDEIGLVISDVSLPGKTGLELAQVCLHQKPTLKVLFVSGWTGAEFLEYAGVPRGDLHFLPKPFRASEFVSRVRKVLQSDDKIAWLEKREATRLPCSQDG
jgi:CheY-like chemotaxis protein